MTLLLSSDLPKAVSRYLTAQGVLVQMAAGYLTSCRAAAPATMQPSQQPWSYLCAATTPCPKRWRDAGMLWEVSCPMLTSGSSRQSQVFCFAPVNHCLQEQGRVHLPTPTGCWCTTRFVGLSCVIDSAC